MSLIWIAAGALIGIPLLSFIVTTGIFVNLLQWGLMLAILGYLLGIPWSIWFRVTKGRWPRYE